MLLIYLYSFVSGHLLEACHLYSGLCWCSGNSRNEEFVSLTPGQMLLHINSLASYYKNIYEQNVQLVGILNTYYVYTDIGEL